MAYILTSVKTSSKQRHKSKRKIMNEEQNINNRKTAETVLFFDMD